MTYKLVKSEHDDLDKYDNGYGGVIYYKKGTSRLHNPYGPAVIYKDGGKVYIIEGVWHRLDGPARIYGYGEVAYYINGSFLTKEEFEIHPERLKFLGKEYLICLK